jgi:AraC-like DNA-binding protein
MAVSAEPHVARTFELAAGFRVHLIGLYSCAFGAEWTSGGLRESDYVHHIDLAFTGRRQVVHGSRCIDIEPGMAYFLPGNTPVERRCLQKGRVLYLKFRCEWLPGVDPLLDWTERTPTPIGPFAMQEWQPWLKRERYTDVNALMRLHAQVENWLAGVLPPLDALLSRHLETHARFTPVFSLVEQKLGADLRISELAKAHGTSLHAFSMAFSANTQISPKEYFNRRLNQEALQLVIGTNLKIKEIADRLRFTDEFYFSRFFQKLNGVSPSRYRNRFYA